MRKSVWLVCWGAAIALCSLALGVEALGADHDGHGQRFGQGRTRRCRARRDGRSDQRVEGHEVGRGRHERDRRLRASEHHSRHLHGRSLDAGLQDPEAHRRVGQRRRPRRGRRARDRSRRRVRDRGRHRGSPADPGIERRAFLYRHHGVGREPAALQPQLCQPDAIDARGDGHDDAAGWRRPEQHHDGRRLDDGHRQQRPDAADERRGDCRGQGADLRLPGGVRPVERLCRSPP